MVEDIGAKLLETEPDCGDQVTEESHRVFDDLVEAIARLPHDSQHLSGEGTRERHGSFENEEQDLLARGQCEARYSEGGGAEDVADLLDDDERIEKILEGEDVPRLPEHPFDLFP